MKNLLKYMIFYEKSGNQPLQKSGRLTTTRLRLKSGRLKSTRSDLNDSTRSPTQDRQVL